MWGGNTMWHHLRESGIKIPKITAKEIEIKVNPILREMERVGVKIDVEVLNKLSKKLEAKSSKLEKSIYKLAGGEFNIASPIQLSEILFEKLKLPEGELKRTKSGVSTAASELKKIAGGNAIIKPILEYRELTKLLSTYLKPLPTLIDKNSRLHTHYGQDTSTGRLTSHEPNLQNIPIKGDLGPEIRVAFVAEKGCKLISADYSQIELRVVACLSGDSAMMEAFATGQDVHSRTAAELFGVDIKKVTHDQRRVAKTVNFGVLYGMSPYGLSQALSISQDEAAKYIGRYFTVHRGIKDYCNRMIEIARSEGYVETLFGFRRELPNINSPHRVTAEAEERMAINTPVQGTAAEILKLAMIELHEKLSTTHTDLVHRKDTDKGYRNPKSEYRNPKQIIKSNDQNPKKLKSYDLKPRLILTVHDELVVEVPATEAKNIVEITKDVMENVVKICVPIEVGVGVGANWAEAK
jgi:DNA polymerase-1